MKQKLFQTASEFTFKACIRAKDVAAVPTLYKDMEGHNRVGSLTGQAC